MAVAARPASGTQAESNQPLAQAGSSHDAPSSLSAISGPHDVNPSRPSAYHSARSHGGCPFFTGTPPPPCTA
eukprot:COSAG06_NODE_26934_length_604_cov_1.570297_2_plen_71_part_01